MKIPTALAALVLSLGSFVFACPQEEPRKQPAPEHHERRHEIRRERHEWRQQHHEWRKEHHERRQIHHERRIVHHLRANR